jgi:tetratricopeptide (TPR) repeat protein
MTLMRLWAIERWRQAGQRTAWLLLARLLLLLSMIVSATRAQTPQTVEDARREAQLRYFDALRLKAESQARRSPQLLEEAIQAFEAAIRLDPTAVEPRLDLAEIYFFFLSRIDLAQKRGEEAIALAPENAEGHLLLGRLLLAQLREAEEEGTRTVLVEGAIRRYERVAELDPRRAEAWAFLADLYQMRREMERALLALERWAAAPLPSDETFYRWILDQELSPAQAHYRLSPLYLQAGRKAEALSSARRAYESDPSSVEYASNLVAILAASDSVATELAVYAQLTRGGAPPVLQLGYGGALVRAGRNEEAILLLQQVVRAEPNNRRAIVWLSTAQRRVGDQTAAVGTLESALRLGESQEEERSNLLLQLGETFEEMGRDEEAALRYGEILEGAFKNGMLSPSETPLFEEVVNRVIRLHRRNGQPQQVETLLKRTRQVIDEQSLFLDLLAIEGLREQGKEEAALSRVRTANRRNPGNRSLIYTESMILAALERYEESHELLDRLIQGLPESAEEDAPVYAILSSIHLEQGDLVGAERLARRAAELAPANIEVQLQLGAVLEHQKEYEAAEQILRQQIERDPTHAAALNNLGYFFLERGTRFDEALSLIERAVRIEPINANFLDSYGWAYFKLGRLEEAAQVLRRAIRYSNRNGALHEHLGDVLSALGRRKEARQNWQAALQFARKTDDRARLRRKMTAPFPASPSR